MAIRAPDGANKSEKTRYPVETFMSELSHQRLSFSIDVSCYLMLDVKVHRLKNQMI